MKCFCSLPALLLLSLSWTARATEMDRTQALDQGPVGAAATARVLADFHDRADGDAGFAWWMRLPIGVRARHAQDPAVRHWRNRVEFLRDAARGDASACVNSGMAVLDDPALGCDFAHEWERWLGCLSSAPESRVAGLLTERSSLALARLRRDAKECPDADAIAAANRQFDLLTSPSANR